MNLMKPMKKVIINFLGFFFAILALFPLLWMVLSGFKAKREVLAYPFKLLPNEWMISNYTDTLQNPMFIRTMVVTFAGAIIFTAVSVAINSMAAYVFARLDFAFKKVLWIYVISTMFIPGMAILVTSFIVVTNLNMLDTMYVLILPGLAGAFAVFFVRQFYLNIPIALEEAAMIDGATRFGIYRHVFLPMSFPPFVIIGIGAFLGYWNSYIWPTMTITNPDLYQISQFLATFRSERTTELGLLMAGSSLSAISTFIFFLVCR